MCGDTCLPIVFCIGVGNWLYFPEFYLFILHDHHDHGATCCSSAMD